MLETKTLEAIAQFRSVPKAFHKVVSAFVGTRISLDQSVALPALYRVQHSLCSSIAAQNLCLAYAPQQDKVRHRAAFGAAKVAVAAPNAATMSVALTSPLCPPFRPNLRISSSYAARAFATNAMTGNVDLIGSVSPCKSAAFKRGD